MPFDNLFSSIVGAFEKHLKLIFIKFSRFLDFFTLSSAHITHDDNDAIFRPAEAIVVIVVVVVKPKLPFYF